MVLCLSHKLEKEAKLYRMTSNLVVICWCWFLLEPKMSKLYHLDSNSVRGDHFQQYVGWGPLVRLKLTPSQFISPAGGFLILTPIFYA